jgi:4-hydroxybenzoate polyprenyltransferase
LYGLAWAVNAIDTTLSDIRDIVGDRIAGVHTLPVVLGGPKTLGILTGLDMAIAYLSPQIAIYGLFLIIYFRKDRHSLRYDLLVDGWLMWVYLALSILERT